MFEDNDYPVQNLEYDEPAPEDVDDDSVAEQVQIQEERKQIQLNDAFFDFDFEARKKIEITSSLSEEQKLRYAKFKGTVLPKDTTRTIFTSITKEPASKDTKSVKILNGIARIYCGELVELAVVIKEQRLRKSAMSSASDPSLFPLLPSDIRDAFNILRESNGEGGPELLLNSSLSAIAGTGTKPGHHGHRISQPCVVLFDDLDLYSPLLLRDIFTLQDSLARTDKILLIYAIRSLDSLPSDAPNSFDLIYHCNHIKLEQRLPIFQNIWNKTVQTPLSMTSELSFRVNRCKTYSEMKSLVHLVLSSCSPVKDGNKITISEIPHTSRSTAKEAFIRVFPFSEQLGPLTEFNQSNLSSLAHTFRCTLDPSLLALFASTPLSPPIGCLVSGPPGTGKTTLVRQFAQLMKMDCLSVRIGEIVKAGYGEMEKTIHQLFLSARESSPCVLLLDNLHALVPRLEDDDQSSFVEGILRTLCFELDSLSLSAEQIVCFATTPSVTLIPSQLQQGGRLDVAVSTKRPSIAEIISFAQLHLSTLSLSHSITLDHQSDFIKHQIKGEQMTTVKPKRAAKPRTTVPTMVGGKYKLEKKIGAGSFGAIYKGSMAGSNEIFAVKLEPLNARMPQLQYEYKLYRHLNGSVGIPQAKWFGKEGPFNVMVMDLLGKSLDDLICAMPDTRFSLKTTIMLAEQMISRLEFLHSKDYIHRDIKPDNFLMGSGDKSKIVYLIDYGLAKRYRDSSTHQHIPYKEGCGLTGTVRYASINAHHGIEQSRRDDLEAVGYILVYFATGGLPWQGLNIENRNQKFKAICDMKMSITLDALCKDCPKEFATYLDYVKHLHFDSKPDYNYLKRMFHGLFQKMEFVNDFVFDWTGKESDDADEVLSDDEDEPNSDENGSTTLRQKKRARMLKVKNDGPKDSDTNRAVENDMTKREEAEQEAETVNPRAANATRKNEQKKAEAQPAPAKEEPKKEDDKAKAQPQAGAPAAAAGTTPAAAPFTPNQQMLIQQAAQLGVQLQQLQMQQMQIQQLIDEKKNNPSQGLPLQQLRQQREYIQKQMLMIQQNYTTVSAEMQKNNLFTQVTAEQYQKLSPSEKARYQQQYQEQVTAQQRALYILQMQQKQYQEQQTQQTQSQPTQQTPTKSPQSGGTGTTTPQAKPSQSGKTSTRNAAKSTKKS
ncbi:putative Casein kinase I [Blattamonas nauphoetae]|uniref:non-specific serine/threonine protein kinase n=1 Tax=Blattamonas nauphoetae TaxID=2049346 RepID=A0ABQ9XL27_9EUKA|nr:putative Casein kinase I [Blattamonas nauphoetae]